MGGAGTLTDGLDLGFHLGFGHGRPGEGRQSIGDLKQAIDPLSPEKLGRVFLLSHAAESIRSLRPIGQPSRHPRVRDLQKQRAVRPRQVDPLVAQGIGGGGPGGGHPASGRGRTLRS